MTERAVMANGPQMPDIICYYYMMKKKREENHYPHHHHALFRELCMMIWGTFKMYCT